MFARLSAPIVALTAALLLATHAAAAGPAALPSGLHEAGGRPDLLYVVLFSLPDCPYCVAVREAYLPALPHDPRFAERVRIREVSIGSTRACPEPCHSLKIHGLWQNANPTPPMSATKNGLSSHLT